MEMKIYDYHDVHFRGRIDRVIYMTTNPENEPREKYANIYLPYGYEQEDTAKKYNVLYLMHGGGGNPDAWLDCCMVKNMLDYCINEKIIEPLIVVFPTFYKEQVCRIGRPDGQVEDRKVREFLPELVPELLPAVEGKYNVYAVNTTEEGLKASRAHRAFGGFSMGSCTTWYMIMQKMDFFTSFVPLSGDSWVICPSGGSSHTRETAQAICDAIRKEGYGSGDFRIFSATGSEDPADNNLTPMIEELKKNRELFSFSEDPEQGNLHYFVAPGRRHAYQEVYHYLYTYLPYLFR